jgi:poly(ribitol-phosphate) beta-N-acetylglucosaminyltransferase
MIRVSVVVPVYNTGRHIEQLIASLVAQTLPQEQFEVIFVDDGSTDSTPARLDALAEQRANVVVMHEPNSGWPGRPRNVGIDAARGQYVFFADHDDWFGVEALERMTTFAAENESDLVIGRYAGHRRGVAKALFARTRPLVSLADAPLMDSLTPHKMFRKAFLDKHELRYPEGRRRLEDHVFVTRAYFLAERISILADYHCYFHVGRDDAGNAGYQRIDPAGYYGNVREVVDIVLAHTEPGSVRDRYLRRTLRTELLARLDGRRFLEQDAEYQREVFDQARRIAIEKIPLSADAGLPAPQRVRAVLLRAGRRDDLAACVEHGLRLGADVQLDGARWEAGVLVLDLEGHLIDRNTGGQWCYQRDGDAVLMPAPAAVRSSVPPEALDCARLLGSARLDVVLRRREDSEEWPVPTESSFQRHDEGSQTWLTHRASARVDPRTLGGGRALTPGIWDVYARVNQTGFGREARLGANRSAAVPARLRTALMGGQLVTPYWTDPHGNLSLDVGANPTRLLRDMGLDGDRVTLTTHAGVTTLRVSIPVELAPDGAIPAGQLSLRPGSAQASVELDICPIEAGVDGLVLTSELPQLAPGAWQVQLELDVERWPGPRPTGVHLVVSASGELRLAATELRPVGPVTGVAPSALRRAARRGRRRLGPLRRRLAALRRSWRR